MRTIHIAPISAYLVELLAKALNVHGFNLLWQIGINSDPERPHPASDLVPAVVVSLIEEPDGASEAFLHRFGVPVVLAISSAPRQRQAGSRLQATYLFDRGYRHLVVVASRQSTLRETHLETIRQMCSAYGVEAPVVVMVPENRSALRRDLATLLSENPSPIGVCAVDDETAFAILAALADLHVPVPERVAVIGSGDISLAPLSFPALTTIGIDDPASYIELLVANILAASRGEPLCDLELLPCRVVVRESA